MHGLWLVVWDATFRAEDGDLTLGEQEELGFGARVATAIAESNGGVTSSSDGRKTASGTWGESAARCDYCGLMVANPLGRGAMRQGGRSPLTDRRGRTLRPRFGAAIHRSAQDAGALHQAFLDGLPVDPWRWLGPIGNTFGRWPAGSQGQAKRHHGTAVLLPQSANVGARVTRLSGPLDCRVCTSGSPTTHEAASQETRPSLLSHLSLAQRA